MKRLLLFVQQPNGSISGPRDVTNDVPPESRIGLFIYPSGKKEFGQIEELVLKYTDGHIRTYKVVEVN